MKTARVPADASSGRRAQPVRQARTNPSRANSGLGRSVGARDASGGGGAGNDGEEQTEIYPAITHFADAITALPRELVRHFTLLKEVDAKIFAPEEALGQLITAALNYPLPQPRHNPHQIQAAGSASLGGSANASINGSVIKSRSNPTPDAIDGYDRATAVYDPENLRRRQLFRQCAYTIQEMFVSLDEKNHVISTATEALDKHMSRLNDCLPYVEKEVSDEARYGSTTHWAYSENRIHNKTNDRSRRETANVNALTNAAAAAAAEEAAARSDARKQAMLAKKGRQQHVDSDFDDHHDNRKGEKRPHGNTKKGRPADSNAASAATNGGAHGNPPSKRRKVDKGPSGGAVMERSLSAVFGANGTVTKGKANSPRQTPVPDPKKRSKAAATTNAQPRKRAVTTTSNAMPPNLPMSPVQGLFADAKAATRISPPPTNGRPTTTRARGNSTQGPLDSARQRPSSSASNKPPGANGAPDLSSVASVTGRPIADVKTSMKESAANSKGEHLIEEADPADPAMRGALLVGSRKDAALTHDEPEPNGDAMQGVQTAVPVPVTTKSGRASKPSTPAMPTFPEPPARGASRRSALEVAGANKRSHKKGAGQAALVAAAPVAGMDGVVGEEEEEAIDADEPRYCYCNGVSYGEMVACDADGCAKEWFHLDCVGLKVAPKGNAKWYCDDCKENMKSKRFNGR